MLEDTLNALQVTDGRDLDLTYFFPLLWKMFACLYLSCSQEQHIVFSDGLPNSPLGSQQPSKGHRSSTWERKKKENTALTVHNEKKVNCSKSCTFLSISTEQDLNSAIDTYQIQQVAKYSMTNLEYHHWRCSTFLCISSGSGMHCDCQSPQTESGCPGHTSPRSPPWTRRWGHHRAETYLASGRGPCRKDLSAESVREERRRINEDPSYLHLFFTS